MANEINFVKFNTVFLDKSSIWLTDPELKQLTLTPDFTTESQKQWFDSLSKRDDYKIWGVIYDDVPVGAVGLKRIDNVDHSAEYFGYIGEKNYWHRGIGTRMLSFAIDEAKKIDIKRIDLYVFDDNSRAIGLYKKFGFVESRGDVEKDINLRHYQYWVI